MSIFVSPFTSMCLNTNIMIFFSLFIDQRYGSENITPVMQGAATVAAVIGSAISSPLYTPVAKTIGRKRAIVLAYLLMLVMNTVCALLALLPKEQWKTFYWSTVAARLVLGYGDG